MDINYIAILPEIILAVAGILLAVLIPYTSDENQPRLGYLALGGVVLAFLSVIAQWGQSDLTFSDTLFQDQFALFARIIILISVGTIITSSIDYLQTDRIYRAEYFSLLLFAAVGMGLMAASADLIVTFLGIEVLSIATYVLAGFRRDEMKSIESGLKYFILGAFSTGFLLYGVALVYGTTATTKYLEIARTLDEATSVPSMLYVGIGLILVGFGFKAALAPFHVWTPDVYEGAPTPITAHLAVASKAAALIAFVRILYQVFPDFSAGWQTLLWVSAVLTMLVGNVAALAQTNIKRMLGYSSIAHAGYLLVGVVAHNELGGQGVLFYLLAYAFMNLGALIVVQIVGRRNEKTVEIKDYAGLGFKYPGLGLALSVFLVSLAGIPFTGGFAGKLFLFSAAIESQMYWLVVIAVIASAIGIYYYLRVMVFMYMRDPEGEIEPVGIPLAARILLILMVVGTLYLGILPGSLLNLASEAIRF